MNPDNYKKVLHENVTKTYKKIDENIAVNIEKRSKIITEKLGLDDRIETTAKKEPFITIKDHKPNFNTNPKYRLINPTKAEIGKISKCILDRINKNVLQQTGVNIWRNTADVINWFKSIENKPECRFISFDVVDYYPSITEKLLNKALDFACQFDTITPDERDIIIHAKRSLMHTDESTWGKTQKKDLFDVTMGSWDGAETCELVGNYILSIIEAKHGNNIGLYRDDGLGAFKATPQEVERIKKSICKVFKENGLKITVEANLNTTNFLDVTFDLAKNSFEPYAKPNNTPAYIHAKSNHPPVIIRNLPSAINKRLSEISSCEEVFNNAKPLYQEALKKSGYNHELKYEEQEEGNRRNRARKIIWYNPPYSNNVQTSIGHAFLKIIKEQFPREHKLHKIFNTNTVKLSYCCMPNMKNIIDGHNKKTIDKKRCTRSTDGNKKKLCNCRNQDNCPMKGQCLRESIIYQATVTTSESKETYIGLTKNTFKERYNGHKTTFKNANKRNNTELSKYIWNLKDQQKDYNIEWEILRAAKPYSNKTKRCELCNLEKVFIIRRPELGTLNKRNELASSCRHRAPFLFRNFKP
jgi:hypothetical protein